MKLIHNERVKLTAAYLNTAATSSFAVGVIAPVAASFYNVTGAAVPLGLLVLGTSFWFGAAVALHSAARWTLGELKE